jgi:hypothetical protein
MTRRRHGGGTKSVLHRIGNHIRNNQRIYGTAAILAGLGVGANKLYNISYKSLSSKPNAQSVIDEAEQRKTDELLHNSNGIMQIDVDGTWSNARPARQRTKNANRTQRRRPNNLDELPWRNVEVIPNTNLPLFHNVVSANGTRRTRRRQRKLAEPEQTWKDTEPEQTWKETPESLTAQPTSPQAAPNWMQIGGPNTFGPRVWRRV